LITTINIKEIEPMLMSRQRAAKFLCISPDHLDSLEVLPEFPEDCMVLLNSGEDGEAPKKRYKHYTVIGLRQFVANCILTTRKIRAVERSIEG